MNADDKIKSSRNYYMELWSATDAKLREAKKEIEALKDENSRLQEALALARQETTR